MEPQFFQQLLKWRKWSASNGKIKRKPEIIININEENNGGLVKEKRIMSICSNRLNTRKRTNVKGVKV